jgi:hypothetical protein
MGRAVERGGVELVHREGHLPVADVSAQIDRILSSESFKNSESLRGLLVYLGRLYSERPDGSVSEHELAVSVFGRRPDFDSRADSVVRVHTGRLRSRLAEYYMSEGDSDEILIEIPKGRYCLLPRHRATFNSHDLAEPAVAPEMRPVTVREKGRGRWWRGPAAAVIAALALVAIGVGLGRFLQFDPPPPALSTLWRGFIHQNSPTLVIFSNPPFVGSPYTGLHLFRAGVDSPSEVNDFYSGPGEVVAAHRLTATFLGLGSSILAKRAQSLSWEDVSGRSIVIVGSPAQNLPAKEIPIDGFHFTHGEKFNEIVNEKPAQGEQAVFRTYGPPYTTDYAIVAYGDSPDHARPAMVLAGTTTYGTQAAAEYVTNEARVSDLLSRLGVRHGQSVPHFAVILEQKIIGGAIVQCHPVLVRIRSSDPNQGR